MPSVEKLRRKPKHFHNFTVLTLQQFDQLLAAIEPLYEKAEVERLSNPNRLRPRGAGRKFKLELPERLLMSLMYLRLYPTQTLLGYLFGLDTTNVSCEVQGRMLEVLSEVLPAPAREEPLDLALAASSSDRSSGRSGGGKRKRRIGTLDELCSRSTRSSRKPSSMAPNRSCPSPKTRAAAKTSTPANARGAPPRCRW